MRSPGWTRAALGPGALALSLVLAVAAPASASAATAVESGWWNEASVGPVNAPSATPSDQLQVSNGFSGPLAFAAVRISLPAGTPPSDVVTLRLVVPSGSSVGTPAVSACPTAGAWKPGADQKASAAPGYSCRSGRQADGHPGAGTESWAIPFSWAQSGTLSVALVPTPGTTTPFSVTYDAPSASSISVARSATAVSPAPAASQPAPGPSASQPASGPAGDSGSGASPAGPGAGTSTSAPSPGVAAVAAPGSVIGSYGAGPAPALGAVPSAGSTSLPTSTGAASIAPSGATAAQSAAGAPLAAAPGGGVVSSRPGNRAGRVMAFCLLVALGLTAWFLAAQQDRAPRLLGPLAARMRPAGAAAEGPAAVRGLGRFARPRSTPPRRL